MYDQYEEPFDPDDYLDWMYKEYCKEVDNPLSFDDWLDQFCPPAEEEV